MNHMNTHLSLEELCSLLVLQQHMYTEEVLPQSPGLSFLLLDALNISDLEDQDG